MTPEQFAALMQALNDLADECARAFAQARVETMDAPQLIGMVRQVSLFLQPPDGLEPLAAVWPMGRRGNPSKVPAREILQALRDAGFIDERVASITGCSRAAIFSRRTEGAVGLMPCGRTWR
jgi:hypothetical protein